MDAENFASFIQQRRKELGLTQSELAEKIHVTDKAISRWERAVGFPDIKLLEPLAEALEITLTELLQSQKLESENPSLDAQTERILQEQRKISWKRRVLLYLGYLVIAAAAWILIYIAHNASLDIWMQYAVYAIAWIGTYFTSRAWRFVVEKLYLRNRPLGKWQNYYTWIAFPMVAGGYWLLRYGVNAEFDDYPKNIICILAGIFLMLGGFVYYAVKQDNSGE